MSLRNRLLLAFAGLAFAPMLAVCAIGYVAGTRAVGALLRGRAEERAERIAHRVEQTLGEQQERLRQLARGQSLGDFVRATGGDAPVPPVPETARAHLVAFFESNRPYFESLTCFGGAGQPLFRLLGAGDEVRLQTENLVAGPVRPDENVWGGGDRVWRSPVMESASHGSSLLMTAPVPAAGPQARPSGALVLEIRLKNSIRSADESETPLAPGASRARHAVIALDKATGVVIYHTNPALHHQTVASAMPYFEPVVRRLGSSQAGEADYETPDGDRWLASFRQMREPSLALVAGEDYTAASAGVRRAGAWSLLVALAAGAAGLALIWRVAGRAERDLRRISLGAKAVAAGDFNQRVETEGMGAEARELAEGFNRMSERLRAHITTTSETRQFESFMRLSAMLSHDLKNAIAGLSLLVTNMEKHIHREEFRADAISSLRQATDKLRRLVARLNEPVKSLSGEYRREARPTDLVAVIRRVLAANVEPHASLYEVEARLPEKLVATVEPDRIENVVENLVINAVEAMGAAGGRLSVEAGELGDGFVYFAVADTGVGMDETFLRTRLYRPFATTKTKGIGLGLYTCREVVEAHGGRLEVESRLGVGTRFRVVLPSRLFISGDRRGPSQKGKPADPKGEHGS
ncbi:MAG TPA: ATP-binding protein [Pyrinomonadaceae bacterium]|nr:ATP-binding protein [Pyrinomonadaceae bacterium]